MVVTDRGAEDRSGHQMTASPIARLIAAPAPPNAGIRVTPSAACTSSADAVQRTTVASPPDA